MAEKLWKGRFTEKTAKVVEGFTASIEVDQRLYRYNIEGSIVRSRMEQAASSGYINATDLADYLVRQGMTFREAHHCVGQAVRYAIDQGRELNELPLAELQNFTALIQPEVFTCLQARETINRRSCPGGTAEAAVRAANQAADERLG